MKNLINNKTCTTLLIVLIAAFGRIAHAGLISTTCDPGPIGHPAAPSLCDGVAFAYNPLSHEPVIDVVFTDMKHIQLFPDTGEFLPFYNILFDAPLIGEVANPIFTAEYWGIDEYGNRNVFLGTVDYQSVPSIFDPMGFSAIGLMYVPISVDAFIHGIQIDLSNALSTNGTWDPGTTGILEYIAGGTGRNLVGEWTAVPEPTTLALLSLGLAGLGFTRRRMKA